jgi:general secretion pathway protein H
MPYPLRRDGVTSQRNQAGFTLIELLVVIAIAAMIVAVVPSTLDKLREGSQYRATLRSIVVDLRKARQQAIAHGKPVSFVADLRARTFGIPGQIPMALPEALELKGITATTSETQADKAEIVFLPEGGSTGGTLELIRSSGVGVRIKVDWLFGQVSQVPWER